MVSLLSCSRSHQFGELIPQVRKDQGRFAAERIQVDGNVGQNGSYR